METWVSHETTSHQDHVIAHVRDTSIMGYWIFDETAYLLLDIGFIWNVFLDGEMGLLPHPVATAELVVSEPLREQLRRDIDVLLSSESQMLEVMTRCRTSAVKGIEIFSKDGLRRLELTCESERLVIETSLETGEVKIMSAEQEKDDNGLGSLARDEQRFVREHLKDELGREPSQEEVDEWLRDHTESY